MFDNLFQNLFENAKNQLENQKKLLENKVIDFESSDKNIKIKLNLNLKILDIQVEQIILNEDKEVLEDLLVVNINKAIEKAQEARTEYLEKIKSDIMPNIDDLFNEAD